ncbi:cytochrome P450 family protein [Streptomyces sp. NPDC055607]
MTDATTTPPVPPLTPEYFQDPFPTYAWLRENAPVYPAPVPFGPRRMWMVTRYEDVRALLVDPRFSSDPKHAGPAMQMFGDMLDAFSGAASMNSTDAPEHTRLRSVAAQAFTARRMESWRGTVAAAADRLLDAVASSPGQVDLMTAFAYPLPITIICDILGIPVADQERLGRWIHAMSSTDPQERANVGAYTKELREYTRRTLEWKREHPDDKLLSTLISASEEDGRITEDELVVMVAGFFVAGYETTANLIGNGVLALLDHPEQMALLKNYPDLAAGAVDEILRHTDTATSQWRWTTEDVEMGGVVIPAGETVFPVLGAAHRDPAVFPDPDAFVITRAPNPHIGFGHGIHRCLGAALAHLEAEVAIPALFTRFPDLALAVPRETIWYKPALIVRSPSAVPVLPRP